MANFIHIISTTATLQQLFAQLQQHQYTIANTSAKTRIQKLKRLRDSILQHRTAICAALFADFQKSTTETDLTETLAVVAEINFAIRHLHAWTTKQAVNTPLKLIGTSSYIQYEPKGCSTDNRLLGIFRLTCSSAHWYRQ